MRGMPIRCTSLVANEWTDGKVPIVLEWETVAFVRRSNAFVGLIAFWRANLGASRITRCRDFEIERNMTS